MSELALLMRMGRGEAGRVLAGFASVSGVVLLVGVVCSLLWLIVGAVGLGVVVVVVVVWEVTVASVVGKGVAG